MAEFFNPDGTVVAVSRACNPIRSIDWGLSILNFRYTVETRSSMHTRRPVRGGVLHGESSFAARKCSGWNPRARGLIEDYRRRTSINVAAKAAGYKESCLRPTESSRLPIKLSLFKPQFRVILVGLCPCVSAFYETTFCHGNAEQIGKREKVRERKNVELIRRNDLRSKSDLRRLDNSYNCDFGPKLSN